jgi:hypothetical protein
MSDDLPYYETMYGIYTVDWKWSYGLGLFTNTHYSLTKEYINEGCNTVDHTHLASGSNTLLFLYPHWIKKQYYIEGVVEGQFTLSCDTANSVLTSYRVRLMKVNSLGVTDWLGDTNVITPTTVNFTWDGTLGVGDEWVYPYYMNIDVEKKVLDDERLYVELTIVVADTKMILYHSNDATWEDFKISIPFRGL